MLSTYRKGIIEFVQRIKMQQRKEKRLIVLSKGNVLIWKLFWPVTGEYPHLNWKKKIGERSMKALWAHLKLQDLWQKPSRQVHNNGNHFYNSEPLNRLYANDAYLRQYGQTANDANMCQVYLVFLNNDHSAVFWFRISLLAGHTLQAQRRYEAVDLCQSGR